MLSLILAPLALLAAFVIYKAAADFLAQDRCLDAGGSWQQQQCLIEDGEGTQQ